ncbi:MAG: YkgJ family cysteine cluster protein [Candidatus Freyarchaeota archaeon]|nr:YkgJ family cysteine cluster protein [Candidatus Jordarchaeia archaeon]MBS7269523.1 YkgJ family cysteine cluster protein [Candidatus Jordarchaeia archaeon]MBS7280294.1 YkgJ family cysteine cluster protein [Candidatus Jordarchaeia archaeon]
MNKLVKFPKGIRFQCQKCSRCCRHTEKAPRRILLSVLDLLRIEKNLGLNRENFAENIQGPHPFTFLMKMVNGKCIFLDENNTCKIYEFRPLICRCYPFWIEKQGNKFEFKASSDCPGIGRGNILEKKFFTSLLRQAVETYQHTNINDS